MKYVSYRMQPKNIFKPEYTGRKTCAWMVPNNSINTCACISCPYLLCTGALWRSGWGTALQTGRSRVRFPMLSLDFSIGIILPIALWPCGRLGLWHKWVPGIVPGGKGGRCVGLTTLPPSCADCLKNLGASNSWKSQGLSRPVMLY
jgi:hypothetical protein